MSYAHPTLQAPGQVSLGPGWWVSMALGLLGILEPLLPQTHWEMPVLLLLELEG